MSSLTINETFSIDGPPETVWRLLIDPERVVTCLPGAELVGETEDGAYEGVVKVTLGAVTMSYRGSAVFEEVDHESRYVRIEGRGREKSGSGNVTMTMESRVEDAEGGGAVVTVDARVKLAGKIVRFGRGMIQTVSAELFRDFTACLSGLVSTEGPERPPGGDAPHDAPRAQSAGVSLPALLWRAFRRWLRELFG